MLATKKWKVPRAFEAEFNSATDFESSRRLYLAYRSKMDRMTKSMSAARRIAGWAFVIMLVTGIAALYYSVVEFDNGRPMNVLTLILNGAFWIALVCAACPSFFAMNLFFFRADATGTRVQIARQHYFDLLAQRTMAALKRGEKPEDYTLYLRPFNTTDAMYYLGSLSPDDDVFVGSGMLRSLEESVSAAVERKAPLIGLGIPREHLGAGRVQVGDEEWQEAVRVLAGGARLIVLVPSLQPGTHWEVEHILDEKLLPRCVVINLPQKSAAMRGKEAKRNYRSGEWRRLQDSFRARGVGLPDQDKRGRLMFFGSGSTPSLSIKFGRLKPLQLRAFFDRVTGAG